MKPTRWIVTQARDSAGRDYFSVSANKRGARFAEQLATQRGLTVVGSFARFDFTLAQWGLSTTASLVENSLASRALRNVKPAAARAAGSSRRAKRGGPAFTTPKPNVRDLKLTAIAAFEDVLVCKLRDTGVTQEARDAYDKYKTLLARAIAPVNAAASPAQQLATQNEADVALKLAMLNLVKVAF